MMKILSVEFKLHLRQWPFMLFTIGLPVALLLGLGLTVPSMTQLNQSSGERPVDTHMPSAMVLLALLTLGCSVLPAVLAAYREHGVLRRMSTTPVHPARLLVVQLLIYLGVGVVTTALLIGTGTLAFGTPVPRQWAGFVLVFLLGTAALLAMGLVIGALAPNTKTAQGVGSAVMFPLMFVGGVWIPRENMPDVLGAISDFSVAGPITQALRDTWAGHPPQVSHLVVMAAGLALFGGLAARSFRWE
ncbi:ABC transporter permease [Nonomuraea jiangxiensis]|uniref:Transport permease protein n=1 Tax=Nonomuraea jiangxiensis TaxID=633440 RepID=A0A1G8YFG7_9ACTN|nr:ABC transporter permease [Nonomuraea jiangxiensis]SDK01578.1 ABC-2 type transport system permease protein [Nonomuraea jiangxiensis]